MHAVICYKNFAANRNISHIGLGVAALNNSKCLSREGITTDVWPTLDAADLKRQLKLNAGVSHVVISAPWIPAVELMKLTTEFPRVQFAMNCHSNVGFLQADASGVKLVGAAMEVQRGTANFLVAGNSRKFVDWASETFGFPIIYLPNLYFLEGETERLRPPFHGDLLRVGAFGATRPLKNLMSAAGAALTISRLLGVDLELWINSGRDEGGGCILRAIDELYAITRHATIVKAGWSSWHDHRKTVARMNLLINCSYTESFNMVTADGVAEGVPSVVSDAIGWAPAYWRASVDDVLEIARVGRHLLFDPRAPRDGYRALRRHNSEGVRAWKDFLGV
jgi:hypothetical protein